MKFYVLQNTKTKEFVGKFQRTSVLTKKTPKLYASLFRAEYALKKCKFNNLEIIEAELTLNRES